VTSYRAIACIALMVCAIEAAQFGADISAAAAPSAAKEDQLGQSKELRLIQSFPVEPDVEFLAWSADESKIATAGQLDRVLEVWDWRGKKILAHLKKPILGGGSMSFVGDKVVTSPLSMDPADALTLWDFRTGKTETVPMPAPPQRREGECFDVSGSGNRLAMLRTTRRAIVFDTATWRVVADIGGLKAGVIALNPAGSELATANYDGTVSIYDVDTGNLRLNFKVSPDYPDSIAWAPNGRAIATGESGSVPRLNQKTGKVEDSNHKAWVRSFDPATGAMTAETKSDIGIFQIKFLVYSKDSSQLLSNQQDGALRVWDATDLKLLNTISTRGKADFFNFSPSGRYLAVSRRDSVLIFEWP
jgi:WD40 repeat protein